MIKFNFKKLASDYIQNFFGFWALICILNLIFGAFAGFDISLEPEQSFAYDSTIDAAFQNAKLPILNVFPKVLAGFVFVCIAIIGIKIIKQQDEEVIESSKMPVIVSMVAIIAIFFLFVLLGAKINWDMTKLKNFILDGFDIIFKCFVFLLLPLKLILTYKFYKSKDKYYVANSYIKAFSKNDLKYFAAKEFIDPKDMGRNLAVYFI